MASAKHIVQKFFPKVNKVNDADGPLTVHVTLADGKNSTKKDHNGCALAVACKRENGLDGIIVSVSTAYTIKGRTATRYQLPPSTSREIVSFDRGAAFEPGTYKLDAPCKSARIGAMKGKSAEGSHTHSGNLVKRFRHTTEGVRAALGSKL